jgi:hypothetical protein
MAMDRIVQSYVEQLQIGEEQSLKNLTVYPLFSSQQAYFAYLTLDEVLIRGLVEIGEIDSQGSVPELRLTNKSDLMILILDGEELVGAKQNRIVNTTMLIPPQKVTVIPVSCVEQGRWTYKTESFYSEERMASPAMRAMKAEHVRHTVKEFGEYRSDQGAIWNQISEKAHRRGANSNSMAYADIYKQDKPALKGYLDALQLKPDQSGALFLINGKVVGMDCLGNPETFRKVFKKLVESYALDAVDWYDEDKEVKSSREDVDAFLKVIRSAKVESHPSVGLGVDLRLDSSGCVGFALSHEDRIMHLSVFPRNLKADGNQPQSRMQRASTRRSHRAH